MEENLKNIPEGWCEDELGSLLIEQPKSNLKVSDAANYGPYPFFTSGEAILIHHTKQLEGKHIFLATGGVANVKYYEGEAAYSTDTYTVTTKEKIDAKYLYFGLLNKIGYINANYFEGSGLKHLQKKEFKRHPFLYPKESTEQQPIASILSKVDEAIAETETLIAKYSRIKTGLMQDLLTKGIDENGNIRSEQTHEFKDSPLGRIPKEWECDSLVVFCEKIQDGTHFSPKTDPNGAYKYITSKNIRMGYLDFTNLEYINEDAHKKIYRRCSVKYGDVLLTKDGASTGNICLNPLKEEFSLLSSVALIRGKKDKLLNEFIVQFFMEERGQKSLIDQMSGNAITRITLTKINNTLVKVPEFKEQQRIVLSLKPKDDLIIQEKIKLTKLQLLKAGLMQDLLSGKVRVNTITSNPSAS
jgi:type I restriction enzyme S subunit